MHPTLSTAGHFVPFPSLSKSEADALGRFSLDSGYIYLKFSSLHLKELVLTDKHLRQCQSMKGTNEQSDLIVLTLELKEQKCILCTTGRHAGKLLAERHQRKLTFFTDY